MIMGIEIADVWHFELRLYLKPALGELYKKDSVCTKIRLFKSQYRKFFPRNYRSIRRKGVATGNGWLYSAIGVFNHMSCEFKCL